MCRPVRCTDRRGLPPARLLSAVRTLRRRRSNRESLAILLLLPFLAEDVLAAVLDALAFVGLGLAPATDLGGELADRLLVDSTNLDRDLIGRLHFDTLGHVEIDVVAVAELQLELAALGLRTVADAGDLKHLGKALGDALDQVRHQRTLQTPVGPGVLAVVGRLHRDAAVVELVVDQFVGADRQGALGPLDGERTVVDLGSDAAWDRHRLLADAAHQNTSASTSPPTFCARASLSESTPRGVETMVMPRPLRMFGSSFEPE